MAKKPSAKQLAARRAFAARFGGKSRKTSAAAGTRRPVARFARTRRIASRSRTAGGSNKDLIDGGLAGAATPFANKYLGSYGTPAALLGVGYYRRNSTLKTLGAFTLAANVVASTGVMGVAPAAGGWL